MVKIDKGIPIPEKVEHPTSKYPWAGMDVGDSFLLESRTTQISGYVSSANLRYSDREFEGRMTNEGGRIWRIK